MDRGCQIQLAVITSGSKGVETGFGGANTDQQKAQLRQQEQRESGKFFGLTDDQIEFPALDYNPDGSLGINEYNTRALGKLIDTANADIICLPHGNDSNMTHQRVYALYQRTCRQIEKDHIALLNRDCKTRSMPHQLVVEFNEQDAEWKRELLGYHLSQQDRNQKTRGSGFDDRVLGLNRLIAQDLDLDQPYAEAFALEQHNP